MRPNNSINKPPNVSLSPFPFSKNEQEALNILQHWDGSNSEAMIAPTIYNKLIYVYLKNTFEDELGETAKYNGIKSFYNIK